MELVNEMYSQTPKAVRTSEPDVFPEPDITRDISERAMRLVESGCLSSEDADAICHAIRYESDEVPSFF